MLETLEMRATLSMCKRFLGRPFSSAISLLLGLTLILTLHENTATLVRSQTQPEISLVSLPSSIQLGSSATIEFKLTGVANPKNYEVYFALYPKVLTRTGLQQREHRPPRTYPTSISSATPLAGLATRSGHYRITVPVDVAGQNGVNPPNCGASCAGNYPLELRIAASSTGAVITKLFVIEPILSGPSSRPLTTALLVRYAPNTLSPQSFSQLAGFLQTHNGASLTLTISGAILEQVYRSNSPAMIAARSELSRWSTIPGHELIVSPFANAPLNCLPTNGALGSLQSQLLFGRKQAIDHNGLLASPSALDLAETSSPAVVRLASSLGFHTLVVPETLVSQLGLNLTLSSPVLLSHRSTTLFGIDPLITNEILHATSESGAAMLNADLAQIYFEAPYTSTTRVIVGQINLTQNTELKALGTAIAELSSSPIVHLVTVGEAQTTSTPLQLSPSRLSSAPSLKCSTANEKLQQSARSKISGLSSIAPHSSLANSLAMDYLQSESQQDSPSLQSTLLKRIVESADQAFSHIGLVTGATVTLTAKNTSIPVTVTSNLHYPVHVLVRIDSLRLDYPSGPSEIVTISKSTSTISIPVTVKSPGSFPISIALQTPNGTVISRSTIGVRSTAFSLAGLILTFGALGVFLTWWGRSLFQTHSLKAKPTRPNGEPQ